jgi:hypothetical protein
MIKKLTLAMMMVLTTMSGNAEEAHNTQQLKLTVHNQQIKDYISQYSFMYKFSEDDLTSLIMNYNELIERAKNFSQQYFELEKNLRNGGDWKAAKQPLDDAYKAFVLSGNKLANQNSDKAMKGPMRIMNSPQQSYMYMMKSSVQIIEDTISSYMQKAIRNNGEFGSRINADNLVINLDKSVPFNIIMISRDGDLVDPVVKIFDTTDSKIPSELSIKSFDTIASFSQTLPLSLINYKARKNYQNSMK